MPNHIPKIASLLALVCLNASGKTPESSLLGTIGWLHGNCLAIRNAELPPGTVLRVVELKRKKALHTARIENKILSSDGKDCQALLENRKNVNMKSGNTFYHVSAPHSIELGIGVLASNRENPNNIIADYDNNGVSDTFHHCMTSEGVQFSLWAKKPYRSKQLWSDYYYLGYDTVATCK